MKQISVKVISMEKHLFNNKVPAYVEAYNSLYADIKSGIYAEGESIPGEKVLAEKYGISRNTLRQALAILCEDGLIQRSQGKGTIVCARKEVDFIDRIMNPLIEMAKEPIEAIDIQYNFGPPTNIARSQLELNTGDIVIASDIVYKTASGIIGYSFTQVPTSFFSDLEVNAGNESSIEEMVTQKIFSYAKHAEMALKLVSSNESESSFMEIPEGTPLILVEAILREKSNFPFARCKCYFKPDDYHIRLKI